MTEPTAQPETETPRSVVRSATPTAVRVRALREVIGRIRGPRESGDSATEDLGAAQILASLEDILGDMESGIAPETPPEPADAPRSPVQAADGPAESRHAHDGPQAASGAALRAQLAATPQPPPGDAQTITASLDDLVAAVLEVHDREVRDLKATLARIAALAATYPVSVPTNLLDEALGVSGYDGPSVREAAEADRRWALEREGE